MEIWNEYNHHRKRNMKTKMTFVTGFFKMIVRVLSATAATLLLVGAPAAHGQGTITFDAHPLFSGTNYVELGMRFQVIIPTRGTGSPNYDSMAGSPAITYPWNTPYNSTPYMLFFQQFSPDDYVALSLTNGYSFGLTSIQLADANSPSSSQVPIMFEGFKADGSIVTNIFTTPGGGATNLMNYSFNSDFISGLTSVDILAPRWAMDNLVFGNVSPVPEPGAESLIAVGLLAFAARKIRRHRT
jgi:hypothetical protein